MAQIQFHNRVHQNNLSSDVGSREDTSKLNYFFSFIDYETLSLCILQNVSVVLIKN